MCVAYLDLDKRFSLNATFEGSLHDVWLDGGLWGERGVSDGLREDIGVVILSFRVSRQKFVARIPLYYRLLRNLP